MAALMTEATSSLPFPVLYAVRSPWGISVAVVTFSILFLRALRKNTGNPGNDFKEACHASLGALPGPKPLPILGNAFSVDINALVGSVLALAWKFQPLCCLSLLGTRYLVVSTPALCRELCDETRFHKFVALGLERLRPVTGDGLFTAFHGNEAWAVAHRLMLPLFGTFRIRDMFADMKDIAEQLTMKWARLPEDTRLDPGSDFTRLTLDTVALTCLDFRFNSFYRDDSLHPFVYHVNLVLAEAAKRSTLPNFARYLRFRADAKFKKSTRYLFQICQDMIDKRRRQGEGGSRNDVLSALVFGRDPKKAATKIGTEGRLSDEHIIHNMLTFLSAGHETTSAMLTTICFYFCEYPETQAKAQHEVDTVVGSGSLEVDHIQKLPYLEAVIKEALRLVPTAPTFFVTPHTDGILGGKYQYRKGDVLAPALEVVQRHAETYGPDAHEFKPERMLRSEFAKLDEYAFKPFGNGLRGCIGRTFVYQESLIILALLLQKFDLRKDDPSYKLKLRSDLSVKPAGFYMRVRPRQKVSTTTSMGRQAMSKKGAGPSCLNGAPSTQFHPAPSHKTAKGQPIMILHGSNTGTCAAVASTLASACIAKGFAPHVVDTMDSAVGQLSTESPVIMLVASYNGLPAENTTEMMAWLDKMSSQARPLQSVQYAVFGCGHSDWKDSYQRVPMLVDQTMAKRGATRLVPMGTSDGATGNVFADMAKWSDEMLFPALYSACNMQNTTHHSNTNEAPINTLDISVDHPTRAQIRPGYFPAVVTFQQTLSKTTTRDDSSIPVKRHIELRFQGPGLANEQGIAQTPDYIPGDHLLILPRNDRHVVNAILARFGLSWDAQIVIGSGRALGVDDGTRLSAAELLGAYVELPKAITSTHVKGLLAVAVYDDEDTKSQLSALLARVSTPTASSGEAQDHGSALLCLLQRYPDVPLPFSTFLQWTAPIRPRTYSISSAPTPKPGHGTLTISVVQGGVASGYLAGVQSGDVVYVKIHPNPAFHALSSPKFRKAPLVMIAVGAGLAPFRAVVQDLSTRKAAAASNGSDVPPALLFYGCRGRHIDEMYIDELEAAEKAGVVVVHRAFSRERGDGPENGHKYVTDAVAARLDDILALWTDGGALIRVCAGKKVADAVWQILGPKLLEAGATLGALEDSKLSLPEWRRNLGLHSASGWEGRYVEEVFS